MTTEEQQRQHTWTGQPSDNLTTLTQLTEHTLLTALQQRYKGDHIYTDVGDILIAVNPFHPLPLYTEDWCQAYSRIEVNSLAPHIFKVASRAYNAMLGERKDQVCVISGESGAGKTESAKFIMHQVMSMYRSSGMGQQLQYKISQLNPILEAFGNAQTSLNDNSSRFGKYVQLVFEASGRIVGAGLQQYLLEKSRVCVQGGKERNFHIFYYLYAGLSSNQKERFGLKEPTSHRYLRSYPSLIVDCSSEKSRAMYKVVMESMMAVGFSDEELDSVLTILAGILLLGDIEFKGEETAEVSTLAAAEAAATLLQLESCDDLCFALTKLRTETRGEVVDKCYSVTKATDVRDGLAKALYARLFQWIVSRLNGYLQPYPDNDQLTMGILDIFGFENFEVNSFEQFCINLANEQLQCYFNHQIFAMEKMELEREGLEELDISFTDNKPVLDLFLSKPIGLVSLLNDQCRGLNGSEKAFVHKCKESFVKHPNYVPHRGNALVFTVKHYAGNVEYRVEGFLERNKDSLPDSVVEAVKMSSLRLVRTLFVRRSEQPVGSQIRKSAMPKSQRSVMKALSMSKRRKSSVGRKHKVGAKKKLLTVSAHFRQSLEDLMERLCAATPHFVRCLKPNLDKVPGKWTKAFMLKQLQYTGMLEAVRVRREGFAYRPFFSTFFSTYRPLAYYYTDQTHKGCEVACREILTKAGLEDWRMGSSRVFLRYYHQERLQLLIKDMEDKATLIQRIYRGYHTRKMTSEMRERQKREKEMVSKFLTVMNRHCEDGFPVIVALNRTDNLLAHKRFAHRREEDTPLARMDSYAGLDTQQKNLKKAKKFGHKMMPSLKLTNGSPLKSKTNNGNAQELSNSEKDEVAPASPTNSPIEVLPNPPDSEGRIVIHSELAAVLRSPSRPAPVPRPRSRLPSDYGVGTTEAIHRSTSPYPPIPPPPSSQPPSSRPPPPSSQPPSSYFHIPPPPSSQPPSSQPPSSYPPVPQPRGRIRSNGSSDTGPTSDTHSNSPVPTPRRRSKPYEPLSPNQTPTTLLFEHNEVPHYKLPVEVSSSNDPLTADSSTTSLEGEKPIPKPRKSPTSSPRHEKTNVRAEIRVPMLSRGSDEVSLDFFPGAETIVSDRRGSHYSEGESVLDFIPNGRSPKHILNGDQELSAEDLYARRPSMASNLLNLRLLANSCSSLVMTDEDGETKRLSGMSTGSDNNSEHPPQADKRRAKKGFGFGTGRKQKRRSRLDSCTSSTGGSVSEFRQCSVSSESGEGTEFLGFYPYLDQLAAEDFVLGQPRGTYAICRLSSDEVTPSCHALVLSLGRSVTTTPILTDHALSGEEQFHLSTHSQPFSLLRDLVKHYRSHAVLEDVCLSQPRLLAGVYVPTPLKPMVQPRRRAPVPRKRRKFSKPIVTEIQSVA